MNTEIYYVGTDHTCYTLLCSYTHASNMFSTIWQFAIWKERCARVPLELHCYVSMTSKLFQTDTLLELITQEAV